MPLHKARPWAWKSCSGSNTNTDPSTESHVTTSTEKSRQAAQMAKQLASQSSWADTFVPTSDAPVMTPPESVAETRNLMDFDDAPPSYNDIGRQPQDPSAPQAQQEHAFWQSGNASIPPLPQRNYTRQEANTSINGTFTFYDSLDLTTSTGAISITIDPQPGSETGTINLTSTSGSIKLRFTEEYMKKASSSGVLDRTYNINVKTKTGSQSIEVPAGNGGNISLVAENGSISAKLYMTRTQNNSNITTLSTESTTGSQSIKVRATSPDAISSLAARLRTTYTGSIKLSLPPVWEGMVHAYNSQHGSVDVRGEQLQYQRHGDKEIYAWRTPGGDGSKLKKNGQVIELTSEGTGSIKVDCSAS